MMPLIVTGGWLQGSLKVDFSLPLMNASALCSKIAEDNDGLVDDRCCVEQDCHHQG